MTSTGIQIHEFLFQKSYDNKKKKKKKKKNSQKLRKIKINFLFLKCKLSCKRKTWKHVPDKWLKYKFLLLLLLVIITLLKKKFMYLNTCGSHIHV